MTTFLGGFFFHTFLAILGIALSKYLFVRLFPIPGLSDLVASV